MIIHRSSWRPRASRLPMSLLGLAALLAPVTTAAAQCLTGGGPACVKPAPGEQPAAVFGANTVYRFVRGTDNAVWIGRPTPQASEPGTGAPGLRSVGMWRRVRVSVRAERLTI